MVPAGKKSFRIDMGTYAEACSCRPPCPCELTGPVAGMQCKGVGAYDLQKASFDGHDISGTRIAYALHLGEWLEIYVDQKDPAKHEAAVEFARAALAGFGNADQVKDADIQLMETNRAYSISVGGGRILRFKTEPVLGGDSKSPITHTNTHNPLNRTFLQGQCVECSYQDGGRSFTVEKGRNSYWNNHMKSRGAL